MNKTVTLPQTIVERQRSSIYSRFDKTLSLNSLQYLADSYLVAAEKIPQILARCLATNCSV